MYYLGVSCYYHDSAAAIVNNGEIMAAVQEERYSRKKNESRFPKKSIDYCLSHVPSGSTIRVVYFENPKDKIDRVQTGFIDAGFKVLPKYLKWKDKIKRTGMYYNFTNEFKCNYSKKSFQFKFCHCEHHKSHAASAFYASPFYKAAVLIVDSVGEWECTSVWKGYKNSLKKVSSISYPNSLGLLYSAFTQYCGFKVDSGEYKLMGLAPYGKPIYKSLISSKLLDIKLDGSYRLNMKYFDFHYGEKIVNRKFEALFGKRRREPDSPIDQFYCDIACSIQSLFDYLMVSITKYTLEKTGMKTICKAGGVALNCVANGKIGDLVGPNNIWIQPAAGDAGCALGSALWGYYSNNDRENPQQDKMKGALLGPKFSKKTIISCLESQRISFKLLGERKYDVAAKLLADKKIVGLFQGRMEYGPRALGSRSILADSRIEDAQRKINMHIKFRESFRPFAPVTLEEDAKIFFDVCTYNSYMLFVGSIKNQFRRNSNTDGLNSLGETRSIIPAITHVDYSCRIQVVDEVYQSYLYNLLKAFKRITGIGCLVNTSFNIRGEPIVCTPYHAIMCFKKTGMDYLIFDDILVAKDK